MLVLLILGVFLLILFVVLGVAFTTLYERHLLGSSQVRLGPTKTSFVGVLQAAVDGVKLMKKEQITPFKSMELGFLFIPGVSFLVMFFEWFTLPYLYFFFNMGQSILMFLCLVGFSVYTILLSGVLSKSKYSMVGALRASSQSISYEIAFSLYLILLVVHYSSVEFVFGLNLSFLLLFVPVLLMVLGELNRAPFDFSEGESELVSGFNVEYSSVAFVLLFLSEYGCLLFFSMMVSVFFFNMSLLLGFFLVSVLIFIRSSYPRYRYDLMMGFFWFKLLPLSLILLFYFVMVFIF